MTSLLRLAPLCALLAAAASAQPTYNKEVSRILQARCQQCHRPNDIAPFALMTYEDAKTYARDIRLVLRANKMPPWKPVEGHGNFRNSLAIPDAEKKTVLDWIAADMPEGDEADKPEPPEAANEWVLGEPDVILKMPAAYSPPAGKDMYRCFVLPTGLDADKFLSGSDVLPGARGVVHHVILYTDTSGTAEKLDAADPDPGYTCYGGPGTPLVSEGAASVSALLGIGGIVGAWAPGQRPGHLPDGVGMFLDRRATIVMQVHYYSTRLTAPDQTRIGLYFSTKPVQRRLIYAPVVPTDSSGRLNMVIPANAEEHKVEASFAIPPISLLDITMQLVYPHMHLLGRKIQLQVDRPRQQRESLILIDDWDFNWQGPYTYVDPIKVPGGSTFRLTCTYDNSVNNPRNPAPEPKTVRWGEGTEDEMCLAFVGFTFDFENLLGLSQSSLLSTRRK